MRKCWLCGEDLFVPEWCSECSSTQPREQDVEDDLQLTPLDQLIAIEKAAQKHEQQQTQRVAATG